MKKRILFVMSQFNMGGIEKELLCLFAAIDVSQYDLDLYLTGKGGQLESEVPEYVSIYTSQGNVIDTIKKLTKKGRIIGVFKRAYYYLRLKMSQGEEKDYWGSKITAVLPCKYDCVIAYDGLDLAVIGVAETVDAKKRLLWEHGPLMGVSECFVKRSKKAACNFDRIVCVSEALKTEFSNSYGLPKHKFCVIYNLVNTSSILKRADAAVSDMPSNGGTVLVTVGRLHPQKGSENIPHIAKMLVDAGCNIYWYLVGDGVLRKQIEAECIKCGVEDRVILLGSKNNPYPYIKNCNIYVQTSIGEGWCLTVQEARILCKPMVVTPLPVIHEQIVSGVNGLIAADMTPETMCESIKTLIDNAEMREHIACELAKEKHDNISDLQKIYDIIEADVL